MNGTNHCSRLKKSLTRHMHTTMKLGGDLTRQQAYLGNQTPLRMGRRTNSDPCFPSPWPLCNQILRNASLSLSESWISRSKFSLECQLAFTFYIPLNCQNVRRKKNTLSNCFHILKISAYAYFTLLTYESYGRRKNTCT